MAAASKPEPGTAVVERAPDEGIGKLPDDMQQQIVLRRMMNKVAAQIAGMSWGQNIGADTARALAEWGRRYNVDVTQEIDILGNRVYLNARFYLRRLSELIAAGLVDYAYADHIHPDERLAALGERGEQELARRTFERARYNAPEKAVAIVAFRVKMRSLAEEIVGVNWAGGGVRKSDPVGDAEPVKTAESRAARRAMRQLVSHVPALVEDTDAVLAALPGLQTRIKADHQIAKQPSSLTHQHVREPDGYDALPRRERKAPRGEIVTDVIDMKDKAPVTRPLDADPYMLDDEELDRELLERDQG